MHGMIDDDDLQNLEHSIIEAKNDNDHEILKEYAEQLKKENEQMKVSNEALETENKKIQAELEQAKAAQDRNSWMGRDSWGSSPKSKSVEKELEEHLKHVRSILI